MDAGKLKDQLEDKLENVADAVKDKVDDVSDKVKDLFDKDDKDNKADAAKK